PPAGARGSPGHRPGPRWAPVRASPLTNGTRSGSTDARSVITRRLRERLRAGGRAGERGPALHQLRGPGVVDLLAHPRLQRSRESAWVCSQEPGHMAHGRGSGDDGRVTMTV